MTSRRRRVFEHVWMKGQGGYFTEAEERTNAWIVHSCGIGEPPELPKTVWPSDWGPTPYHFLKGPNADSHAAAKAAAEAKADEINDVLYAPYEKIVDAVVDEYLSIVGKVVLARPRTTNDERQARKAPRRRVRVLRPENDLPDVWPWLDDTGIYGWYMVELADVPRCLQVPDLHIELPVREVGKRLPRSYHPIA